jgi:PPP family 3-phenylpropionic acid transporter
MTGTRFATKGSLFSFYMLQAVLLPYLPVYFGLQGYSSVQIGWLMNIGPFVAVFAQPVWGYLSDKYQSIKGIIGLLWALTILSSIGLFLAGNFASALLFVMLVYFFMYPSIPLLDSLIVKSIRGTGASYGSVRLWGSAGFMTSALLSGYALTLAGGIDRIGYVFWTLWVIPFFCLFFLRDEKQDGAGAAIRLHDFGILFRNRMLVWFLILVLMLAIPHRINDVMLTLHLAELGASDSVLGVAWAVAALGELIAFALFGKYLRRFHELAVIGFAAVLYTIRWLATVWIDDPAMVVALQFSHLVTFALFWMAAIQYIVRIVPPELSSTGQSLISAVFLGLSGLLGGVLGGWFRQEWGGDGMFYFCSALSLFAAVLILGTRHYSRLKGRE